MCDDSRMSELSSQITTDAAKAASTSVNGVSVSRRSLAEQIAADKYLASLNATSTAANRQKTLRGMLNQIVPPGGNS